MAHVGRECNIVAHTVAFMAKSVLSDQIWIEKCLLQVSSFVLTDKNRNSLTMNYYISVFSFKKKTNSRI